MFRIFMAAALLAQAACATATAPDAAQAQQSPPDPDAVQVMVVGSYHMFGSKRDIANIEVGSVLAPNRQKELADVAASLAEFNPTVVATERETDAPEYVDPFFEKYSKEMLASNPNERVQVAYRLADKAGVSRVYGIDETPSEGEPDYFPFDMLAAHAQRTGQSEKLQSFIGEAQKVAENFSKTQSEKTIAELLIEANKGELASPEFYYRLFVFDRGENQPGSELQAYWFMRNAKIFSKLMQVTNPGDRVVVVYGAGHKHWLEHFVEETPGFSLVDPVPYLRRAAE